MKGETDIVLFSGNEKSLLTRFAGMEDRRYEDQDGITSVIRDTKARLGIPEIHIPWMWSMRFSVRMGEAWEHPTLIRFSYKIWPLATVAERHECIVHEVCHVANFHLHGRMPSHGRAWKDLMGMVGYPNPSVYHTVNLSSLHSQ